MVVVVVVIVIVVVIVVVVVVVVVVIVVIVVVVVVEVVVVVVAASSAARSPACCWPDCRRARSAISIIGPYVSGPFSPCTASPLSLPLASGKKQKKRSRAYGRFP